MNFYVVPFGYEFSHHQNIDARTKVNSKTYSGLGKLKMENEWVMSSDNEAVRFDDGKKMEMMKYAKERKDWTLLFNKIGKRLRKL